MNDEIEVRLRRAVSVTPSDDGLRWLDSRVAQIMERPAVHRGGVSSLRKFIRPLALAAATLVLFAGAVAGGLTLLDRMVESSGMPGWRTAWDRAEILDLRQTDAGITVTLERAYADLNQVLVGFTVKGLETAPISSPEGSAPIEWEAQLRDPSGRAAEVWATSTTAIGTDETGVSAVAQTWEGTPSPRAGTWELTFTSIGYHGGGMVPGECTVGATDPACVEPAANAMIEGTWRFTFELPALLGKVFSPNVSDTVGPATVTLTELVITPTMVRAALAMRVDDVVLVDWQWPNPSLLHRDTQYTFNSAVHVTLNPGDEGAHGDVNEFMAPAGTANPAGTWEIEIPDLDYSIVGGGRSHLDGPWMLTVTVP